VKYPTNPQSVAWLWDIFQRGSLDLDPPYQRRSVWTMRFKQYFLDTVLLGFPAPAIFLYPEVSAEGRSVYHVVDGKQRILAVFGFIQNEFALSDDATLQHLRGREFSEFSDEDKRSIWTYDFTVCNLPTSDESIINNVFERINRNVARLTRQELRHAKFDGIFKRAMESLSVWSSQTLKDMPRIVQSSRLQMKDVELTTTLCLLIEDGIKSYTADDLDQAYAERDEEWDAQEETENEFRAIFETIRAITETSSGEALSSTRLRNQADFYGLFGAVMELKRAQFEFSNDLAAKRLSDFIQLVESPEQRVRIPAAQDYYDAARSATSDIRTRRTRIDTIRRALEGTYEESH
jgi:hypothetical protein